MPALNTSVKAARLRNEDIEVLDRYLAENGLTFSKFLKESIEKIKGESELSRHSIPKDIIADFNVILKLSGTNFEEFFKALYAKVENFEIEVDDILK